MWIGARYGWVLVAILWTASCASGKGGVFPADEDAGPTHDATVKKSFGEECSEHAECESELCHDDDTGDETPGTCSLLCDDGCPSDYACGDGNVCVPASEFLCSSCTTDEDCGGQGNRCVEYASGSYCASDCSGDGNSCPDGFGCETLTDGSSSQGVVCMSESEVCCIDADGDFRGEGDDCRGPDCDESNADIYDDAAELCDSLDNDCDGTTDVDVTDCAAADCRLGSSGYVMRENEACVNGACVEQDGVPCGVYTCADGGDNGDVCATSCDGEDNQKCSDGAHCDASACEVDYQSGIACDEASDCLSDHCQNDFCCAFGDCCQVASDCPSFGTFEPVCENPQTCQGTVGAAVCTESNTCATTGTEQNDSACGITTVADECGFFLPVFCNGAEVQDAPVCPTTCTSDAQCDENAYCDDVTDTCVEDEDDGQSCSSDSQCAGGHCQNGFCCASGDCCESATDCPEEYSSSPVCSVSSACQGQVDVATCTNSQCGTINNSPDDSACTILTIADECGPYPAITCTGDQAQDEPECATSCTTNSQCDPEAYCNALGQCEFDEPDGSVCTGDAQCIGDHCENGFCCASGDCCFDNADCSHLSSAPTCDDQTSCQGERVEGVCSASFQCSAVVVQDDSACDGLPSNDCGPYQGVSCSNSENQPNDQAGLCATSCTGDSDCDGSAHCDNGACVPDAGQGGFCSGPGECSAGLQCVDNVCCATACTGDCEACDLPGSLGTCTTIASGEDPDAECGDVDCSGFYFGWEGDTCFAKADVTAAGATCGGGNACGSTADECLAQSDRGTAEVTCDAECQEPNLATCSGTTAGTCTNLDLGTETCGDGVCQVTTDRCTNGEAQTCTPNLAAATAETCDGLDNNCNGQVDEGALNACGDCRPGCQVVRAPRDVGRGWRGDDVEANGLDVGPDGALRLSASHSESRFAWIANTLDGSVTKIDLSTGGQVGEFDSTLQGPGNGAQPIGERCFNDPGHGNCPSRTAVDAGGNVYIANRAFENQGTLTKIANEEDACVDRNGNGRIDTSRDLNGDGQIDRSSAEFLGQEDECLLWTINVGENDGLPRAVAIDANGFIWVGLFNEEAMVKITPDGEVVATVSLSRFNFNPYGAAVAGDGTLWVVAVFTGQILAIDTDTNTVLYTRAGESRLGCRGNYGIAIDTDNRVWLAGFHCTHVARYDPRGDTWFHLELPESGVTRGVAADDRGYIYLGSSHTFISPGGVLGDPIGRITRLRADDGGDVRIYGTIDAPIPGLGTVGVGLDDARNVWAVNQVSGTITRLNPETGETREFPVGDEPYTYSDFTGFAFRTITSPSGSVRVHVEGCGLGGTEWEELLWRGTTPGDSTLTARVRVAATREALDAASWVEVSGNPALLDSLGSQHHLEVEFRLGQGSGGESPSLQHFDVQFNCPLGG